MAAYAALLSLMHTIDQLQHHPSPPVSIDNQQVESLTQQLIFFQEFLEGYNSPFTYSDEADPLEIRIADAAHAVEDVIESYIVENIKLAAETTPCHDEERLEEISCIHLYEDLQKVMEEMDSIKKEVMEMEMEMKMVTAKAARLNRSVYSEPGLIGGKSVMVGFDDLLLELLDKLTRGEPDRQIIPIVGMGGIGKTTLARNIYRELIIKEHFDICMWVTISQDYNVGKTLVEALFQAKNAFQHPLVDDYFDTCDGMSEYEIGQELYKYLCGRRYLIILDDMWSIEFWDKLKFFFPDYNNGSRVLVTTRLSNLAGRLAGSSSFDMRFLDEVSSWDLFSRTIFGKESFPLELEEIGKKIVEKCNGLPLAIVVIGGLLAKSQHTRKYWVQVEGNLNSVVNSEDGEHCLRILKMSYNHLPAYLKPCFLYVGVFMEDHTIKVSTLTKLWVSEGFLKPINNNKSLEIAAEVYLKELVDRNLILVYELGSHGNIKHCAVHDLVRDLSMKEAQKQGFYHFLRQHSPQGMNNHRRMVIHGDAEEKVELDAKMSLARSYLCCNTNDRIARLKDLRLLRTLSLRVEDGCQECFLEDVFRFTNLRYLDIGALDESHIPSSICLLWNLRTLIVSAGNDLMAPVEIWKMQQLRYVEFTSGALFFPDPQDDCIVVLENLHTLVGVQDLNLNEELVKRIPHLKKLEVTYIEMVDCLSYLHHLSELEALSCSLGKASDGQLHKVSFPHSLKRLKLIAPTGSVLDLEHMLQQLASLPLLEKLVLVGGSFPTNEWETIHGQFQSLKFLLLHNIHNLEKWTMSESSHFPLLQKLHLFGLRKLEEIPFEIGEIEMLESIALVDCSETAVLSAKKIVEEQEDLHGEQLQLNVHVVYTEKYAERDVQALQYLASPNFLISEVLGVSKTEPDPKSKPNHSSSDGLD